MTDQNPMAFETAPQFPQADHEYLPPEPTSEPAQAGNVAAGTSTPSARLVVSVEMVVYAVLILLSITLRTIDLGAIPLNDRESYEALAAFRTIEPRAAGSTLVSQNPVMYTSNVITMSIVGANTAGARVPTVIVGILLVLAPILFRRWLTRAQALIMAALLTLSPVLLLASRSMSGAVWSTALALVMVYGAGRFLESRRAGFAVLATTAAIMLVLLAEPAGFLAFLGIAFGTAFALATTEDPDGDGHSRFSEVLRQWPWLRAGLIGAFVSALVAMVFLLHPEGLSGAGNVLFRALQGLVLRTSGQPFAFPVLVSLLYEPVLWVFGLTGAYMVLTKDSGFVQRGLVGWLFASLAWSLGYGGAEAGHALWLTIPLATLSAIVIEKIISPVRDRFWAVPTWGPWVQGIAVAATLSIAAINLVIVGNGMLLTAPDALPSLQQPLIMKIVMIVPALLLAVITFFLVGSMWGARASWHGTGIGVLLILSVYSLGSGWHAAIINADNPRELWQVRPAARNLNLMDKTLVEASLRATGMPYEMQIVVQPGENDPFDSGALAWALHRFYNTQFVPELSPAISAPLVIAPQSVKPKLGAAYVGQDFPLTYHWDRGTLRWDLLSWIYSRDARVPVSADDRIVTWLRSDIYGLGTSDSRAPDAR